MKLTWQLTNWQTLWFSSFLNVLVVVHDFVSKHTQNVHPRVTLTQPIKLELVVSVIFACNTSDSVLCWFLWFLMPSQTGAVTLIDNNVFQVASVRMDWLRVLCGLLFKGLESLSILGRGQWGGQGFFWAPFWFQTVYDPWYWYFICPLGTNMLAKIPKMFFLGGSHLWLWEAEMALCGCWLGGLMLLPK